MSRHITDDTFEAELEAELSNFVVVKDISNLPTPVWSIIQLQDNFTYLFRGIVDIGINQIQIGVSNIIMGRDKSNDGILYSGTDAAVIGTNNSFTASKVAFVCPLWSWFELNWDANTNLQIRESIFWSWECGTFNGGWVVVFNNNFISDTADFVTFTGTFSKIAVSQNIYTNSASMFHLRLTNVTSNTIKIIDNDFPVDPWNIWIEVTNDNIINQWWWSIVWNTFSQGGTYIQWVDNNSESWVIEANGQDIVNTSDRQFVRKVRTKERFLQFLWQADVSDYVYEIDWVIDMEDDTIVVPATGITINWYGNNFSKLITTSDNATLFSGGWNLFCNNLVLSASGLNSKIFDITDPSGNNAVEFVNVNFEDVTEMWILDWFRQWLLTNGFFLNVTDWLTFRWTWSGWYRVDTTLGLLFTTNYLFRSDVWHTFWSRFVSNANLIFWGGTGIWYDFREDSFVNDASFQLIEAQFSWAGTYVANTITNSSIKSLWRDCVGVDDTFQWVRATNLTDTTTALTNGVYSELEIDADFLEETWFVSNAATNYWVTYNSSLPINISVELISGFSSGNNNQMELEIRKYPSWWWFEVLSNVTFSTNGGALWDRSEALPIKAFARVEQNDQIRVFIRNNSDNDDVVTIAGGGLTISKR